ncbi:MAG: DEAD/DEAH box helicase [Verrucomicrobia bacterium]|nr:DEAD/DEAH box helicase [Verrucomicrobiota bacterium]MBU4290205.1 DEAD/DEAH box helicase [Verrucomicrobiota bacterium]MBU4496711.1 DEAD/DEAH box helicase [Verrucomicrobiota bacterium]MCG2680221.1 DEAD/DEAH box helicase [Kiritimatiellia bacterium]
MRFESFALGPILQENIRKLGFETPTPIQSETIPAILEGRDVMGLAQTGTGKTAAFALPLLQRLMTGPRRQLRALIICPTRELAEQTFKSLAELGAHTNLHCVTIYGGVGIHPQITSLRRGAEIAIACPGRLLDHIGQGTIRLSQIECLVLDEADRMFDMGFLPDIRRILGKLPTRRQNLLFSATMPDEVRGLVRDILRDPVTVQIAHSRPAASVSHALYPVLQHLKTSLLLAILERTDRDSVLVFTRTKHRAKSLAIRLSQTGHRAACLQGNLSQRQRALAMDGFRSGRYQILVATDLAARGIDVSTISHVINFDMPHTVDDYTHRIGRTGRAAKTGDAFTLITAEDEGVVRGVERVLGARIERRKLENFDYAARPPPASHSRAMAQRTGGHAARPYPRRFGGQSGASSRHDGHHERRSYQHPV